MRVQETVKKESLQIAVQSGIATVVMWICIFILHHFIPEKVSFDYRVILSGLLGTVVAVMNFLLMGITVQSVLSVENQEEAYQRMRLSYRKRTMLQLGWISGCGRYCSSTFSGRDSSYKGSSGMEKGKKSKTRR